MYILRSNSQVALQLLKFWTVQSQYWVEITIKQSSERENLLFLCFVFVLWLPKSAVSRCGLRTHRSPLQMEQEVNTVFIRQCYLPLFVLVQKQWWVCWCVARIRPSNSIELCKELLLLFVTLLFIVNTLEESVQIIHYNKSWSLGACLSLLGVQRGKYIWWWFSRGKPLAPPWVVNWLVAFLTTTIFTWMNNWETNYGYPTRGSYGHFL